MSLSTTQYGYIVDPMVPFTDDKGKTIKNGFIRVFMAGTSTPVLTYRNYDGATNQEKIELDNSGRVKHNVIGSKGSLYKVVVYNILHSQENPLLTVDKITVLGASINASGATIVTGLDSVTVQEENFLKATVEGTGVELALDPTEVTSEVSTTSDAVTAAPDYVVPLLGKTGTEDSKKISLANLFKFALDWISRLATTITSFASGDFIAVSNTTDGARKMATSKLLELTAQNSLAGNVAEEFEPGVTEAKSGYPYIYEGALYVAKVDYQGVWDASKFEQRDIFKFLGELSQSLRFALNIVYPSKDDSGTDVKLVDEEGNVLAIISDEGLKAKYFDSSSVPFQYPSPSSSNNCIHLVDSLGNILAEISEEGIKTKKLQSCPDVRTDSSVDVEKTLNIADEQGNILAEISKDGIKTLNFSSDGSSGEVSISNGDCLTILGSSFGETSAFPANKHWSGIMSMFTDYRIQVLAAGGSNVISNLYWIRKGTWKVDGKYVLISNNENARSISKAQLLDAFDNLCVTLKGMGKEPIIATNYHATQTQHSEFKTYAKKNNLMFWDCSNYTHSLVKGIYGGFDDGAHLRKRNAPLTAFGYLRHLLGMERPEKSLKLFRVREEFTVDTHDSLVFRNNFDRAQKFKEIAVSSIASSDEYEKLKNGTALPFTDYALVSCVLPFLGSDLKTLALSIASESELDVYVKNTIVEPYPNPVGASSSGVRFSVSSSINVPSDGDVYSVEGTSYLVRNVVLGENGYYCTIYCTPATLPSGTSGTMARVSQVSGSTGDASIAYDLVEEITFNLYDFVSSDNCGHWVKLEKDQSGAFVVEDFVGSVNIDKVDFLVVCDGSFSISGVSVKYAGSRQKHNYIRKEEQWEQNDYIHTSELLPESTFGSVGDSTSFWKDDENQAITSVANYETTASGSPVFPEGCSSEIVVDDNLAMNCSLSSSILDKFGDMVLEIWCRYFPAAPTPYTQETDTAVSADSYDFNKLSVEGSFTGNPEYDVKFDFDVGLFWQIVRIPMTWYYQHYQNDSNKFTSLNLRISSVGEGIEICKVSLKYK